MVLRQPRMFKVFVDTVSESLVKITVLSSSPEQLYQTPREVQRLRDGSQVFLMGHQSAKQDSSSNVNKILNEQLPGLKLLRVPSS